MAPNLGLHPDLHRLFRCRVKVERWIHLQSEKVIENWTNYKLVKLVSCNAINLLRTLCCRFGRNPRSRASGRSTRIIVRSSPQPMSDTGTTLCRARIRPSPRRTCLPNNYSPGSCNPHQNPLEETHHRSRSFHIEVSLNYRSIFAITRTRKT